MYTILLFFIITTLICLVINYYDIGIESFSDFVLTLFLSSLQGLIGGMIGFLVALCFSLDYETIKYNKNIVSLKDNTSIKGNFFLGTGHIEGSMKYVFYVENNDNTYSMNMLDFDKAKIKYSTSNPKLKITKTIPVKNQWNNWAIDLCSVKTKYLIEVPIGTIKNDFQLDSE
jgi:hypothetical protein